MRVELCRAASRALLVMALSICPAWAEVSRVEIVSREPVAEGRVFGSVGAYEEMTGRIHFAIDPENPRNRVIAGLDLAPRNPDGFVEMSADLAILAPVEPERGNGIALVDIANRGRQVALRFNGAGPGNAYGDGFLMERGYTIVWVGWEFDVPAAPGAIRLDVARTSDPEHAPIGGLGFAAVRDAAAWIRHANDAVVSADHTIAFGVSQSGRFLRNYLYLGFNTDESGRQVFDGVIPHIAGASRIDLNRRGAEPISQGQFTATSFPFADAALRDPVTGAVDGTLDNPRSRSNQPRVFYINTSVEYWGGGRVAALVHSTPDGMRDLVLPDNVRVYFLAGTQHGPGAFPPAPATVAQEMGNPTDYWWNMRALLVAMEQWLVDDIEPPASAYPSFADGTLVAPTRIAFPAIPGVRSPAGISAGVRAANPLLTDDGAPGTPLPLLVPQVDGDGNETSGIRHPEVAVPLATYTGWNFFDVGRGDPNQLVALAGAYVPFPATRQGRAHSGDPRRSIEERYASREAYLARVEAAAAALVAERYLLEADVAPVLERAGRHWDLLVGAGAH